MNFVNVTEVVQTRTRGVNAQGVLVDVRSESEFADGPIPMAVNVPLLNDLNRAEIGTLYKRAGADAARRRGLEIVRPLMPRLFHEIGRAAGLNVGQLIEPNSTQWDEIFSHVSKEVLKMDFAESAAGSADDSPFVSDVAQVAETGGTDRRDAQPLLRQPEHPLITLYCWRGGARSCSMALFARLLGFQCQVISGGYKAFRREVLKFLNAETYPFKLCTLYGLTGSGKTRIIKKWKAEGRPVIDLEGLAHHRGSAFGQIGIDEHGRQKDFENKLFWEMQMCRQKEAAVVVVEGESRRIGLCQLPEKFMDAMLAGLHVHVTVDIKERVKNILEEYVEHIPRERMLKEARSSLDAIKRRLGLERHKELSEMLARGDYAQFTEDLLVHYYDKTYANSRAPENFYHAVISGPGEWNVIAELTKQNF